MHCKTKEKISRIRVSCLFIVTVLKCHSVSILVKELNESGDLS